MHGGPSFPGVNMKFRKWLSCSRLTWLCPQTCLTFMTVDACVFRFAVLSVIACHDMEQAKALSHELGLVTRAMADWMFPAKAKTKRKTVQLLASCQCAMQSPMARFYEPLQEIRSVKRAASYARYLKKNSCWFAHDYSPWAYWHVCKHRLALTGQGGPLDLRAQQCRPLLACYLSRGKTHLLDIHPWTLGPPRWASWRRSRCRRVSVAWTTKRVCQGQRYKGLRPLASPPRNT